MIRLYRRAMTSTYLRGIVNLSEFLSAKAVALDLRQPSAHA